MSINLTTLIGEMIAFAILIWFCVKFIWPNLTAAIEERQKKIAAGLAAADQAKAELKAADAKVETEIRQARKQAGEIIDRAQRQASEVLEQARDQAVKEIDRLKAAAEDEIAQMAQKARDELRSQVGSLALQAAQKIVQREIDPAAHRALIEQLATEL